MIRKISIGIVCVFVVASIIVFGFGKQMAPETESTMLQIYTVMSISIGILLLGGSLYNLRYIDKKERIKRLKRLTFVFGIVIIANSIMNSEYSIDGSSIFFAFCLAFGTSFLELSFMKRPKEVTKEEV